MVNHLSIKKIVGKTPEQPGNKGDVTRPPGASLNIELTIPLKYLSKIWRFLNLLLLNCEIEFDLSWTKDCVLIEHHNIITGVNSMITSTKLYIPVATLSINDNIKFLKNMIQGFKRTIAWNKYRSKITTQEQQLRIHDWSNIYRYL